MGWGVVPAIYGWDGAASIGQRPIFDRLRAFFGGRPTPLQVAGRHPERGRSVSVIVAARNYGRYLDECLRSIQANRPDQIVYVDDASDDASLRVARKVGGVEIVPLSQNVGAAQARNAGLDRAWGEFVVHVDGDDCLPTGYLDACSRALVDNPDAPFVYTAAQAFGDQCPHWQVPTKFDRGRLWERNYVHTSAMYRKSAVDRAGGWTDVAGTCWDWSLALRASRFGDPVGLPNTHILYRQHSGSWSRQVLARSGRSAEQLGKVRSECARKTIGLIYSGRLGPNLLTKWCDSVVGSLTACGERGRWDLVLFDNVDNCRYPRTFDLLSAYTHAFRSVRLIPGERVVSNSKAQKRDAVAKLLARQYTQIVQETPADILWLIEDDVIVPTNACGELLKALCESPGKPHAAVAGIYRSRHEPMRLVAHLRANGSIRTLSEIPDRPMPVDFTGTGCLMFWKDLCPGEFGSHFEGRVPAHDWEWCDRLSQRGDKVTLIPGVSCQHYVTESEAV